MNLVLGIIKASGDYSDKLILVTIIALVIAAILFGMACFSKSDVNA